jgi:hypothetical protein
MLIIRYYNVVFDGGDVSDVGGLTDVRGSGGGSCTLAVLCCLQGVKRDIEGTSSRRQISVSLIVLPFDVKLKERSR